MEKDKVREPGCWPADCPQRAFAEGAAWWQYHAHNATMFPSEHDEAEIEAVRRYGVPLKGTGGIIGESDLTELTDDRLSVTSPPYFEDNEPCGYCSRQIGSHHQGWCRQ